MERSGGKGGLLVYGPYKTLEKTKTVQTLYKTILLMKNEIKNILYTDRPGEGIEKYIRERIVKRDRRWAAFCLLVSMLFLSLMYSNRTTRADVLKAARPLLDSTKVQFQLLLDFKVDSLVTEYGKGRKRGK